jgi:DNA-binding transcriptional ArsR family regulator
VLRESGLVSERRDGVRRLYRARPEALSQVRAYIDQFWEDGLERLRVAAEAEQRQSRERNSGAA